MIHIVPAAGQPALCGQRDPMPYVGIRWAAHHRYPADRCPQCHRAAGLERLLDAPTLFSEGA